MLMALEILVRAQQKEKSWPLPMRIARRMSSWLYFLVKGWENKNIAVFLGDILP